MKSRDLVRKRKTQRPESKSLEAIRGGDTGPISSQGSRMVHSAEDFPAGESLLTGSKGVVQPLTQTRTKQ